MHLLALLTDILLLTILSSIADTANVLPFSSPPSSSLSSRPTPAKLNIETRSIREAPRLSRRADYPPNQQAHRLCLDLSFSLDADVAPALAGNEPHFTFVTPEFDLIPGRRYYLEVDSTVTVDTITFHYDDLGRSPGGDTLEGPTVYPLGSDGDQVVPNIDIPSPRAERTGMKLVTQRWQDGGEVIEGFFSIAFAETNARGYVRVWQAARPAGPPAWDEHLVGGTEDFPGYYLDNETEDDESSMSGASDAGSTT